MPRSTFQDLLDTHELEDKKFNIVYNLLPKDRDNENKDNENKDNENKDNENKDTKSKLDLGGATVDTNSKFKKYIVIKIPNTQLSIAITDVDAKGSLTTILLKDNMLAISDTIYYGYESSLGFPTMKEFKVFIVYLCKLAKNLRFSDYASVIPNNTDNTNDTDISNNNISNISYINRFFLLKRSVFFETFYTTLDHEKKKDKNKIYLDGAVIDINHKYSKRYIMFLIPDTGCHIAVTDIDNSNIIETLLFKNDLLSIADKLGYYYDKSKKFDNLKQFTEYIKMLCEPNIKKHIAHYVSYAMEKK